MGPGNVAGSSSTGTITQEHIKASILSAVEDKVRVFPLRSWSFFFTGSGSGFFYVSSFGSNSIKKVGFSLF